MLLRGFHRFKNFSSDKLYADIPQVQVLKKRSYNEMFYGTFDKTLNLDNENEQNQNKKNKTNELMEEHKESNFRNKEWHELCSEYEHACAIANRSY